MYQILINIAQAYNSKSKITDCIQSIESLVESEEIDALELRVMSSILKEIASKIDASKIIREYAVDEREKWNDKEDCRILGSKVEKRETGVKYNYSKSQAYEQITLEEKEIKNRKKEIETLAKTTKNGTIWLNPDTGEELQVMPAIKTSTTNVVVTLSKD